MSKQWIRCLLAGAMLALTVGSAQAYVVFGNLSNPLETVGTAYQKNTSAAYLTEFPEFGLNADFTLAQSFITPASFTGGKTQLADIFLKIGLNPNQVYTNDGTPVVTLWRSVNPELAYPGGLPNTSIAAVGNLTMQGTLPSNHDIANMKFIPTSSITLDATATYWVSLGTSNNTTAIDWQVTDSTAPNTGATYTYNLTAMDLVANQTAFYADYNSDSPYGSDVFSFQTDNVLVYQMQVDTVPEPSTYALLVISLGVVGYARKKMNLKA